MTIFNLDDVKFKVCEYGDGEPYLSTDEESDDSSKRKLALAFELKAGTSRAEAQTIAAYLNEHITKVAGAG